MLSSEIPSRHAPIRAATAFDCFVAEVEPRLRAALVALYGTEDGRDATAEALAYAWEHWARVMAMTRPAGYLFRVAQSKARRRREPLVFAVPEPAEHLFEPRLPDALRALPDRQRLAVVLVHGLGCSVAETADLLEIKPTTVRNHLERGLRRLRRALGADQRDHVE
ncbi:MAG: RNA polymerase sigma factor [Acidimicrobiales bacterium]